MSPSLEQVTELADQNATTSSDVGLEQSRLSSTEAAYETPRQNRIYIEAVRNLKRFADLKNHWDDVYESDPEAQFFLSWTWLSGYLKDASNWFIVCAKPDAGAPPVAFFPLRYRINKTQDGEVQKDIVMAGNRRADYTGFICRPEFQDRAIAAFGKYLRYVEWDRLYLENMHASNERMGLFLKYFPAPQFEMRQIRMIDKRDNIDNYICPYVDLPETWDKYLNNSLSSNSRYKVRRMLREFENSDKLQITHAERDTVENDVSILMDFWSKKWRGRKGEWLDSIVEFFRRMLMHCFESGSLFLPILWKGDTPLGALASLIDAEKKSLLFLVGSRDETVSSPPPGLLLHAYSIRYAINNGFKTYDFLRGNEPYKYIFGTKERHIRYIIVNDKNRQRAPRGADGAISSVRSGKQSELTKHLLSPSADERAGTHVLFLARHALDSSPEREAKYGYHVTYHAVLLEALRGLGFRVTPASEHAVLFGPLNFDFLYAIHSHAIFDGHEMLAAVIAAYRAVPCLGSSAPTRAISEDKVLAKRVAASLGLDVAKHKIITSEDAGSQGFSLPGSWVIKPRGGIASEALVKVDDESGWPGALAVVSTPRNGGRDFIAEEFVPGLNLTVPVVEGLPPMSLAVFEERGRPGDNVVTHEGKRGFNSSYSSAPYDGPGAPEALEAAAKMAAEISPFDYARFDFRYDPDARRLVFIEVNIACNMSRASAVYRSFALHGVTYEALVGHVLTYSLRRQRKHAVFQQAAAVSA